MCNNSIPPFNIDRSEESRKNLEKEFEKLLANSELDKEVIKNLNRIKKDLANPAKQVIFDCCVCGVSKKVRKGLDWNYTKKGYATCSKACGRISASNTLKSSCTTICAKGRRSP